MPREASGLVSTGYIDFDYEAMPYQRSFIAADSWGTMAGPPYSGTSISILVPEGALGSAIYASLRGPGMLRMAVDESAAGCYYDPTAPNGAARWYARFAPDLPLGDRPLPERATQKMEPL